MQTLPLPALSKAAFGAVSAYTDEALYEATGVRIAFTTREGGASKGPYATLNLGSHVQDGPAAVAENRKTLQSALGCADAPLVVPRQVHGDEVLRVAAASDAPAVQERADAGADGLVVDALGVAALLCFADCVPVIMVAPSGRFAVVHAGWRGVENQISAKAARMMARLEADERNCTPEAAAGGLNVYLGPHIHGECFECGTDVHARFEARFGHVCVYDETRVSLGQALRVQLERVGISPERFLDLDKCTVCDNDEFFSFRAQGGVAGRHGAFAVRLKPRSL